MHGVSFKLFSELCMLGLPRRRAENFVRSRGVVKSVDGQRRRRAVRYRIRALSCGALRCERRLSLLSACTCDVATRALSIFEAK